MTTARPAVERFHQLDGLRAVAVGIVLVHHAFTGPISNRLRSSPVPAWEYLGDLLHAITGSGVELFFVLSGVVLLRPYVRGLRAFRPGNYVLRRVERLWPPYLVVLFLEGLITWAASRYPTPMSRADRSFGFNWYDFALQLPIVNFGSPFWNMAWWSLSVEVLFYLVVPVLLPLFVWKRMSRPAFLALVVLIWFASLLAVRTFNEANAPWYDSFHKLAVYALCFLIGIGIAKFDWSRRVGWVMLAVGGGYVLVSVALPAMNFHSGLGLLYGGLVILALAPVAGLSRLLSSPLMVWVGERSYSLFLVHFTVFFGVNYLSSWWFEGKTMAYFIVTRALGVPLAILAAMVLFQLVERRFARNLVTADSFWPTLYRRGRTGVAE